MKTKTLFATLTALLIATQANAQTRWIPLTTTVDGDSAFVDAATLKIDSTAREVGGWWKLTFKVPAPLRVNLRGSPTFKTMIQQVAFDCTSGKALAGVTRYYDESGVLVNDTTFFTPGSTGAVPAPETWGEYLGINLCALVPPQASGPSV